MKNNSTLVECTLDEDLTDEQYVLDALVVVTNTEEVKEKLQDAYALHGKPLKILITEKVNAPGYYQELHTIQLTPNFDHKFLHNDGLMREARLERALAHEIMHASQEACLENDRGLELLDEIQEYYPIIMPRQKYGQRIKTAKHESQLRQLFGTIYDSEIAPTIEETRHAIREEVSRQPLVLKYLEEVERPAIEFDNLIMQKYFGEPARSTNYLDQSLCYYSKEQFVEMELEAELLRRKIQRDRKKLHRTTISENIETQMGF